MVQGKEWNGIQIQPAQKGELDLTEKRASTCAQRLREAELLL